MINPGQKTLPYAWHVLTITDQAGDSVVYLAVKEAYILYICVCVCMNLSRRMPHGSTKRPRSKPC